MQRGRARLGPRQFKLETQSNAARARAQGTYNALKKLVETKWALADGAKKPVVAWVTTNSSGVSFRLDPYKMTLIKVGEGWLPPLVLFSLGAPAAGAASQLAHRRRKRTRTRTHKHASTDTHTHTHTHKHAPPQDAGGVPLDRAQVEASGTLGSNALHGTQYVFIPRGDAGAVARLLAGADMVIDETYYVGIPSLPMIAKSLGFMQIVDARRAVPAFETGNVYRWAAGGRGGGQGWCVAWLGSTAAGNTHTRAHTHTHTHNTAAGTASRAPPAAAAGWRWRWRAPTGCSWTWRARSRPRCWRCVCVCARVCACVFCGRACAPSPLPAN